MHNKTAGAAFIALLACVLADQASAQGPGTQFNSGAGDLKQISSLLEEFRQDIIHKDGYVLTKLVLNPMCSFIPSTTRSRLITLANITPSSTGSARALWMDLRDSWLNRRTHSKRLVNDKVTNSGVEHWLVFSENYPH